MSNRLSKRGLAVAAGVLWALAVLVVGLANLLWPGYGAALLQALASIYPGYHPATGPGSVVTATLYALVDGAVCGFIFAWVYNLSASSPRAG